MPLNLKNSKYHKAAKALQKAWIKSAAARASRKNTGFRIVADNYRKWDPKIMDSNKSRADRWIARSRHIVHSWNTQGVPYSMRKKNRYWSWSKKRQRWI